ncbi:hypothetical protein [Kaistia nematophila]|uniref:Uncharacterized protein n=1 Tax=Kaistia nematophila TaxID=2994654 RepID=A0A9X3E586_9HYPH|nr:hypothetical protein [Kaistia nematophila]MCX5571486.1 hypothetical protein [Kaistia nematophila]
MAVIDDRTPNRDYLLPNIGNLMRSQEVPRFIETFMRIDEDMAVVMSSLLGKAPADHEHEMGAIIGLLDALAGKAAFIHNHSIGGLQGVDFSGAATNQFAKFNGSLWIPAFIQAADLANKIITNAKLRDSAALSILGRAAASVGSPADISAAANDRLLARVADAIAFVQLTLGMVPDGLLTSAKLANEAVTTGKLATGSVTTPKIPDGAVTFAKLAEDAKPSAGRIGQILYAANNAKTSLSAVIPVDNTVPTSSEGTEILSLAVVPASAASKFRLTATSFGTAQTAGNHHTIAVFRGSTCIAARAFVSAATQSPVVLVADVVDEPATGSSVVYSVRVGPVSNSLHLNSYGNGLGAFGSMGASTLVIEEILP